MVATLMIRDLDEDVKARLRIQAAAHGRSMEAEARAIIAAGVREDRPERGLGTFIHELFAEIGGVEPDELVIEPRTGGSDRVEFSGGFPEGAAAHDRP